MKNTIKFLRSIVIIAVVAFSVTDCNKNKEQQTSAPSASEANASNSIRLSNIPTTATDTSLSNTFSQESFFMY
jgi:outer membrane lipoprotein SlyB